MHRLHVTPPSHPALASKASSSQSPLAETFLNHLGQDFLISFEVVSETSPILSPKRLSFYVCICMCDVYVFAYVYVDLKTY